MGKKYIIEKDDKGSIWNIYADKDGVTTIEGVYLTPYTELDLEQVRKEAYDKGYHEGHNACYETAKDLMEEKKIEAYQRGLTDAWEAARKIAHCFLWGSYKKETGSSSACAQDVLEHYSASEAIEKIRQYEQEQEEIKVGDEVKTEDGMKMVIAALINKDFAGLGDDGRFMFGELDGTITRTGRHFPEIAAVLEKMRGEQG